MIYTIPELKRYELFLKLNKQKQKKKIKKYNTRVKVIVGS